jgi:uncharacterized protein
MESTPIDRYARIELLDVLRGFALLGIVTINALAFAFPGIPPGFAYRGTWLETAVYGVVIALVESKFFTLFSLLFGMGVALQLKSGQPSELQRSKRRMVGLCFIGLLHIIFLWDGDVLLLYGGLGMVLLNFRSLNEVRLRRLMWGLLLIPVGIFTLGFVVVLLARAFPESNQILVAADKELVKAFADQAQQSLEKSQRLSYFESVSSRLESYASSLALLLTRVPTVLLMFVLGFWLIGSNNLDNREWQKRVVGLGWRYALPLNLMVAVLWIFAPAITALQSGFFNQAFLGIVLCLTYASSIALLGSNLPWRRSFAKVGQMALSNYIGQSLVLSVLFAGYGLGLAGQMAPSHVILLAWGLFVVQMVCSQLWLKYFRFGLLEWLWRSWTYRKWQSLWLYAGKP